MITVENLTQHHGRAVVLDALDLSVAPGELVALVGPAGAGKTTALELIQGLQTPTSGRVTVSGFDVAREPTEARAHLACVPARVSLPEKVAAFPHLRDSCARLGRRIPEPVLVAALLRGGLPAEWHPRRMGDYPPALRRKLAFVVAIMRDADALLLDDPTCDLAATDIDELVAHLRRLRKRGLAILLATRDLAFAQRLATRIVVLNRGAVVETVDPNAPRRATEANAYRADLIA